MRKKRLIDATDLVRRVLEERDKVPLTVIPRYNFGVPEPCRHGQAMRGGIRKALREIETSPTVDAVEVVRCKDCLNAMKMPDVVREYFGYREDALDCGMGYGVVLPDNYCSNGCKADAEVSGDA